MSPPRHVCTPSDDEPVPQAVGGQEPHRYPKPRRGLVPRSLVIEDVLWHCRDPFVASLDTPGRSLWRLVCRSARKAVEDCTRTLTWDGESHQALQVTSPNELLDVVSRLQKLPSSMEGPLKWMVNSDLAALAGGTALNNLFPTNLSALAGLTALASLHLERCEQLVDVCASLSSLHLEHCDKLQDLSPLGSCTRLHIFNFSLRASCYFSTLRRPASPPIHDFSTLGACPSLRHLSLRGCEQLRNLRGSERLSLEACPSLESLNMQGCVRLSDISTLEACTRLTHLDLQGCVQLTDIPTLRDCTALSTLNLSGCAMLSDISPLSLPKGCHAARDIAGSSWPVPQRLHYVMLQETQLSPLALTQRRVCCKRPYLGSRLALTKGWSAAIDIAGLGGAHPKAVFMLPIDHSFKAGNSKLASSPKLVIPARD
eukprot:gene16515-22741_t